MNALITGGAGFVGSHLAEALVARGHRVTALDNLSTGDAANVALLKTDSRFKLIVGDVTERGTLLPLVEECDVVFHLAAAVGVRLVVESPVRTIETNLKGTEAVLEAAARGGRKVLLTSTSEVFPSGVRTHVLPWSAEISATPLSVPTTTTLPLLAIAWLMS